MRQRFHCSDDAPPRSLAGRGLHDTGSGAGAEWAKEGGAHGGCWARGGTRLIDAFLDDTVVGPTALVLVGDAGIGKTILWQECVHTAEQRFGHVLTCRGVEAEAALSFAGLSELLAPVLADTLETLAAPRRRALQVALLLEEAGDVTPDADAIGLAVLDVLRAGGRGRAGRCPPSTTSSGATPHRAAFSRWPCAVYVTSRSGC